MRENAARAQIFDQRANQTFAQPDRELLINSSSASKVFIFQVNCLTWKANALESTPK
jgi:hypothetical protein